MVVDLQLCNLSAWILDSELSTCFGLSENKTIKCSIVNCHHKNAAWYKYIVNFCI